MGVNKVEYYGKVLIDLTEDTVAEDTLHKGVTAHDKSGALITGTFSYVKPSGTLSITENGTYDVTEKASVSVSVAGSGGDGTSGGFETCQVTIVQEWGMNDDPDLLHLYVPYYKVLSDGSIEQVFEYFTSANNYEPQHSVTFTALKNVPISVIAKSSLAIDIRYTVSANGGTVVSQDVSGIITSGGFYTLTPTADTATFTFASP